MISARSFRPALAAAALLSLAALMPRIAQAQTLYVANQSQKTIATFAPTGTGGYTYNSGQDIGSSQPAGGNLSLPNGLAFDSLGNLYAANYGGSTISAFTSVNGVYTYNPLKSITTNLINPFGLAFDSSGNLYAANFFGGNISEFNSSGVFQKTIGSGLNMPSGLAFDPSGNLYAANYGNTIIEFTQASGFTTTNTFGSSAPAGGSLASPSGLAFTPSAQSASAAPEASSVATVSLLVLGLGGLLLRARKRKTS